MSESSRKIINIIIALVVSIAGWTYVVYNNDPMTEVRYKDIPLKYVGEDALANRGLGVSQVSTTAIDVTLKQRRIDTNTITAEDIDVIADVSDAAEGENGISLQISGPNGTQVAEAERRSISVEVEPSDTVEKKILVEYDGNIADIEPVTANLTSTMATVIGAESEVERVENVVSFITYDETNTKTWSYTTTLKAVDKDGDVIDHLVIYPREVNFKAYPGKLKEVKLNVLTEDPDETANKSQQDEEEDEGDGYERTYSAPDTIMIKGPAEAVDKIESVTTELIDINNMYEDQEAEIVLDLPEGIHPAYGYENLTVKVNVTKKAVTEKTEEE